MNELVKINYSGGDRPTVSGRELHRALRIKTPYDKWFPRMCEYGFSDGEDFSTFLSESTGGRPSTDHQLTINMAKELCMIQRSDIGKQASIFLSPRRCRFDLTVYNDLSEEKSGAGWCLICYRIIKLYALHLRRSTLD